MTTTIEAERQAAHSRVNYMNFRAEVIGDVITELRDCGFSEPHIEAHLRRMQQDVLRRAGELDAMHKAFTRSW